jgi:hypothetical protein
VTSSDPPRAPAGGTTLSVFLTDAPGDVDSVWIQVDDVVLVGDGGNVSVLDQPTGLLNVTALRDSAVALARDLELEEGSYGQIRFIVGGAVLEASDGQVYVQGDVAHPGGLEATGELHCPSCAQSGIKVKLARDLEIAEGENGLLLDFDVSQSFGHQAGASGRWIMRPVIHAAGGEPDEIEHDGTGGEIFGVVVLGEDAQGEPLQVPACGGEERTLEELVPTATAATLVDDEGEPLLFAGEVYEEDEGYALEIEVAEADTYGLGYLSETLFGEDRLMWTVEVAPAEVIVVADGAEVNGVAYTVTGVTCEPVVVTP